MKKLILCASLVCLGLMTSCQKDELVPEGSRPEWLGESIYSELENPVNLEGTFNTYLRLVDDLGYKDVLSRTGSKTIFPANDEAFQRFFAPGGNEWGVTDYDHLSDAQKKTLFYNSMLDNAILTSMITNVTGGATSVVTDMALKHATNIQVIDSVHVMSMNEMPKNNYNWDKYRRPGQPLYVVEDNTKPMIVHFTRNFLNAKGITVTGEGSDFNILTGGSITTSDNVSYIFDNRVVRPDITCQNGYIHQVENVLVQPGNMASVLRKPSTGTQYFSRILDYFSAPYYDASTTSAYNTNQRTQGTNNFVDSIFQIRYISKRSQGGADNLKDPVGSEKSNSLKFDPGWNGYYPDHKNAGSVDYSLADIGVMFVPSDEAMWEFFGWDKNNNKGNGNYIIDIYKNPETPHDREHFAQNLDSLHSQNPGVLTAFINNLMQTQFTEAVPSKFYALTNDASENLGMNLDVLAKKPNGDYDVTICNNGVIYKLNKVLPPDRYSAVLAPSTLFKDMTVMNWAVNDRKVLGLDFQFYLLAMNANFAFFVPDDVAFNSHYYIDPCRWNSDQPTALRFFYDPTQKADADKLRVEVHAYDKATGTVDPNVFDNTVHTAAEYKTQLADILNTHTVVLEKNETFGTNQYYVTKEGAGIHIDNANTGGQVYGGAQLYNNVTPATITVPYRQANGMAYRISSVIQPTLNSVYATLNPDMSGDDRFEKFFNYINFFSSGSEAMLSWAGISDELDKATNVYPTDRYKIFLGYLKKNDNNKQRLSSNAMDMNIRLFNTYNYTVWAPNNTAMDNAIKNQGLPSIEEMYNIFETYASDEAQSKYTESEINIQKAKLLNMIEAAQEFIRYHLQAKSIFVDNDVKMKNPAEGDEYQTLYADELGVAKKLIIKASKDKLEITDGTKDKKTVTKGGDVKLNLIARDYVFNTEAKEATAISTSSHAVIHELSEVLCPEASGRYDAAWATQSMQSYYGKNYKALVNKINSKNKNY